MQSWNTRMQNYLQLHSFLVVIVNLQADTAIFFIWDSQCDHTQDLHALQPTIPSTGQRYLLLYLQMYTEPQEKYMSHTLLSRAFQYTICLIITIRLSSIPFCVHWRLKNFRYFWTLLSSTGYDNIFTLQLEFVYKVINLFSFGTQLQCFTRTTWPGDDITSR